MRGRVTALVGAQFGSEGKGRIAQHLAHEYPVHVRTGGPNAGHTIRHEGRVWKMQTIPCGWINPDALLVLGAGAVIDFGILQQEILELEKAGYPIADRLFIDRNAALILRGHHDHEGGVEGTMHRVIGSTGEGVGIARMARMARGCSGLPVVDTYLNYGVAAGTDTAALLDSAMKSGKPVLLEGTQGSGLSLIHGIWPFVTSADTNAAQLFADAGLSPRDCDRVILVARTFPIRVAGKSGPLYGEVTWEELDREPEQTTVTKKTRRIGTWDDGLFQRAVMLNQPTDIALTFLDYMDAADTGVRRWHDLTEQTKAWVAMLEKYHRVPFTLLGTGGPDLAVIDRRGWR
jgi:adenylosuccinate synthase